MVGSSGDTQEGQRPQYELLYWPGIPGRGEFVRLAFEATKTPYRDVANESASGVEETKSACCDPDATGDSAGNPPSFAPPGLRVLGGGDALFLSQTPNILLYLGPKLGLSGTDGTDLYHVNALALTALDLNNEAHDTHHPIAVADYYEDQKQEALKKASNFRDARLPKFLAYFERVLRGNAQRAGSRSGSSVGYLLGGKLTYADTTFWHVLSGLHFAFPKEMTARKDEFPLCRAFYHAIAEEPGVKEYLASERRLKFGMGVFRHYPELDRQ